MIITFLFTIYCLFSIGFFIGTTVCENNTFSIFFYLLLILVSPILFPVLLGIKIGVKIGEKL